MLANIEINCPQIEIDIQPYKFLRFVQYNNRGSSPYCEKDDETDIFFLVQHQDEKKKIGLMVCKTYSWRKKEDNDYLQPQIKLVHKDLCSSIIDKFEQILEIAMLKNQTVLIKYRNKKKIIHYMVVYKNKEPQNLKL